jgi:hypothetical protein
MGKGTNREDTLDEKIVVRLEGAIVRLAKRVRKLLRRICLYILKTFTGEVLTAEEPKQPFRRCSLLLALLILHHLL